jgi:hypothetical protein
MIFKYGYYSKYDENQEILGKNRNISRLNAAKYFSARKVLTLKQFLNIYKVKRIYENIW